MFLISHLFLLDSNEIKWRSLLLKCVLRKESSNPICLLKGMFTRQRCTTMYNDLRFLSVLHTDGNAVTTIPVYTDFVENGVERPLEFHNIWLRFGKIKVKDFIKYNYSLTAMP